MKHIAKSTPEPERLRHFLDWIHRNASKLATKSGEERWEFLKKHKDKKRQLQYVLLKEQGYICAYCNRRIHRGDPEDDEQVRIDHLEPKDAHPDKVFDYYNLVGCCHGDEREKDRPNPPQSVHCDVSKGNATIPKALFPTSQTCEEMVVYTDKGKIISKDGDPDIDHAIQTTLNLNCDKLATLRKNIIQPFVDIDLEPIEVTTIISEHQTPDDEGALKPFCGVVIGYLRQNYNYV